MASETPKKGKGKFIILLLLLIILAGAGFAGYKFIMPMFFNSEQSTAAEQPATPPSGGNALQNNNPVVSLPPFMVNLADPLGRRYIKLTVDVEVNSPEAAAELEKSSPKVRDAVNMLLSSKSYADLAPSENKILLKSEIVERLNQILGGPKVARVYFVDMVIQ